MLDSNPRQNLASFVTTWMEPEARQLMSDALNVNFVDVEQYPSCAELERRCVSMLHDLYHAPGDPATATGTATIGSSEAIMLAVLALKKRWQEGRKAAGLSTESPNLVCGANTQVCWEKACRYFEVEMRMCELSADVFTLTPAGAVALVDANTIGAVAILGSTYNGEFEDVAGLDAALAAHEAKTGQRVPIHVDAASGGFVAPFTRPDLVWDFQLPRVDSINVSGHKYGLVAPGLGWLVMRSPECLPEALVFKTHYLGSEQRSFTLNFSKGASTIVMQFFQILRLGRDGFTKVMTNLVGIAGRLAAGVQQMGCFRLLSKPNMLPLVAFCFTPLPSGEPRPYDEFELADRLKARGWVLPAYHMAPNAGHVALLRAVIREDFSQAMCDMLLQDIRNALVYLEAHFGARAVKPAHEVEHAPAGTDAPAAVAPSAAYRAEHAPHRVRRAHKKHAGVC